MNAFPVSVSAPDAPTTVVGPPPTWTVGVGEPKTTARLVVDVVDVVDEVDEVVDVLDVVVRVEVAVVRVEVVVVRVEVVVARTLVAEVVGVSA
jgi:hypothetical protein